MLVLMCFVYFLFELHCSYFFRLLYWTEEGDFPLVLSSTMSGQNLVPLITKNLKWPNALYFDKESDLLWVADGGTLEIMSITAGGKSYKYLLLENVIICRPSFRIVVCRKKF